MINSISINQSIKRKLNMKMYSESQADKTHVKNNITYLNINSVEANIPADLELGIEARTQWVCDSIAVKDGNLIAAGIKSRYKYEDEIALVNNYNADNSDPDGEYAEYLAYRDVVKQYVSDIT